MPLCAAPCRCLQGRSCKYALFLTPPPLCQRGGRRFEPGLVLQHSTASSRCYAEGLCVLGDRRGAPSGGCLFSGVCRLLDRPFLEACNNR